MPTSQVGAEPLVGIVDRMDCGARLRWNPRLLKGSKG